MKIALVLSGGGAKGAFQAGVIRGILRKVDEFVCSFGNSTGALISTCIGAREFDFMERVYTKVQTGNIIESVLWDDIPIVGDFIPTPKIPDEVALGYAALRGKTSLYNVKPLMKLVDDTVNFNDIKNSDTEVGYLTTNLDTLADVFFSAKKAQISPKTLMDALEASISMPIFMPPVKIHRKRGSFVDGGLSRNLSGREVLKAKRYREADVVMFISTVPKGKPHSDTREDSIFGIIIKTLWGLSDWNDRNSLYREVLEVRDQVRKDGKEFIFIQPDEELPVKSSLGFIPEEMSQAFDVGLRKAKEVNKLL